MNNQKIIPYSVPEQLKKYEESLRKTIVISNEITFRAGQTLPWESKLGGCPYLESKEDYPLTDDGTPMMFIAQINLADVYGIDELPKKGLLQFYVEDDEMYGLEGTIVVRYIESYIEDESKVLNKIPYKFNKDFAPYSKEGKMFFEAKESVMSNSIEEYTSLFGGLVASEDEESMFDETYASGSRIGGYPYFVQSDIGFERDNHLLLLQLDIDDECGIMFGDSGNCNFFIEKEDLEKRDFSKVWYDWQCC